MGYLADYLHAHSGTECPDSFITWSALSILGHLAGRKIYYNNGAFKVQTPLYVTLIGPSGEGKSTAKDWAKNIVQEHFPNELLSANAQTPGDIIKLMGAEDNCRAWKNQTTGLIDAYHAYFVISNELKAFLHNDPIGMINFVVDIYGQREYRDSYKNAGRTNIPFPHLSILACATPELISKDLKIDIVAGGLGRRFILVVGEKQNYIPQPVFPKDRPATMARVVEHLKWVHSDELQGAFNPTKEAQQWYNQWYEPYLKKVPENPFLKISHKTVFEMMLRVATLLSLESYNRENKEVTLVHMQTALALIEATHPNIIKLSEGMGRNEIASYGQQIVDNLRRINSPLPKDKMLRLLGRDLRESEFEEQIRVQQRTGNLVAWTDGKGVTWLATPSRYEQLRNEQLATKAAALTGGIPPKPPA